ncbi:MAG: carboxylesterase/lipase family protein [Hydrogenophaga sp.]|uniref:carboxylesterase/lipase family protein n=1 Tax=Hydrogenophaga sp. TaxID=1904254 RepID=UPI0040362CCC
MKTITTCCALAIGALMMLNACTHAPTGPTGLQRTTTFGPVVGANDSAVSGVHSWKGVPFAAPPVGVRRWQAPADPTAWTEPRAATAFAPACAQTGRLYGPGLNNRYDATIGSTLGQTLGSEDCLYLNIWAPAAPPNAPRPVIVWVHGGSNITGYTADPVYDGATLAKTTGSVVVSVAYRLGIFGFLELAALKTGAAAPDSGNFALLDIVKSLEFVQGNIGAFGGDPGRVTLMGESAGAVNVYALLTSPMVVARPAPLFHRLVALSGGISSAATLPPGSLSTIQPRSVWATRGNALLTHALVADGTAADPAAAQAHIASRTPQQLAAHLRGMSADALLTTVRTRLAPLGLAAANPIPDGHVVPDNPIAAIRAGRYVQVPVLAGNTRDESKLFPSLLAMRPALGGTSGRLLDDAAVFKLAHGYQPDAPPASRIEDWVPPQYLPVDAPNTGLNARISELDRIWFFAFRDDVLNALKSRQPEVWHYRFDWDELPPPFDKVYGAAHSFDLPFIFGNFGPSLYSNISFSEANKADRLALSDRMMQSLGRFAHDADPHAPGLDSAWPAWPHSLVFDSRISTARSAAE